MPLYEYQCDACGHRFETIQKFSDAPLESCPTCGGAVRKLFASPAIHFKGSGWYITDYAKKDSGAAEKAEGGSKEGGSREGESKGGGPKEGASGGTGSASTTEKPSTSSDSASASPSGAPTSGASSSTKGS